MPLYEYQCQACGHRFELIRKFSDPPVELCPACGGSVRKLLSSPAIQFKGSGWYITDYARKGADAGKSEAEKGDAGKSEAGKSESGKAESKPESSAATTDSSKSTSSTDSASSGSAGGDSTGPAKQS